jgi:hypothetical protein
MRTLFLILLTSLFIIGCSPSEVITPPDNNNTNTVNNDTIVSYKQTVASVYNSSGDTIYSAVTNTGQEHNVMIITSSQLPDSLKFVRTMKNVNINNPIGFSIAYKDNTSPSTISTKVKGSELSFVNELEIRCQIYDPSGDTWISSADLNSNSDKSHDILSVTNLNKQSIEMRYRDEQSYVAVTDETSTDSLIVYRLAGQINTEFYKKDNPTERQVFNVVYESLPIFLP